MMKQPFSYKLPLHKFDVNLLPPEARVVGTDAFKDAVIAYFSNQYASKGESAIVVVEDQEVSVLTFPKGSDPLDFVMTMLQSGRIKDAIPYLESMTRTGSLNAQVLYNLGIAYSELGQFDEAIIRLKKAVQIDPSHAHAWTGIGVAYQRMHKPELALEAMQKAVEVAPTDGYARRNLGAMLTAFKRYPEALTQMREARKALPHDPQTTYGLAMALENVKGAGNQDEADELYKITIERWPASPVAEQSRIARTRIAHVNMKESVEGGVRPDVVMYIVSALNVFNQAGPDKTQKIGFEIAMKGQSGLDINDPDRKYTLSTLPGQFSGMQLVSIMYAAFKQIDPTMDAGIDLQTEYDAAVRRVNGPK